MALTKTRSRGINLADTFAFTGTVSGASTGLTIPSVTSASGTEVDYFNISSNAKRITLILRAVSTNGSDQLLVQLGTSSGLTSSGYLGISHWGGGGFTSVTNGYPWYGANNSSVISGAMIIYNFGSNYWINHHSGKYNQSNGMFGGGEVQLPGTLDRLRIRPHSSGSFDSGEITMIVEE